MDQSLGESSLDSAVRVCVCVCLCVGGYSCHYGTYIQISSLEGKTISLETISTGSIAIVMKCCPTPIHDDSELFFLPEVQNVSIKEPELTDILGESSLPIKRSFTRLLLM